MFASGSKAGKAFPEKPIKIIVYTKPGAVIDIKARKFTDIAKKYTDATFVVENKTGAGGIVAMKYILGETDPDGYTLDNIGKPDLMIAVVSSPKRLKQFPNVPTFGELGMKDFDNEIMWRGFVVKKGTPEEALKWYNDLFTKVTKDSDWRKFWEIGGIDVVYYKKDKFEQIVKQDAEEFQKYLKKLGLI